MFITVSDRLIRPGGLSRELHLRLEGVLGPRHHPLRAGRRPQRGPRLDRAIHCKLCWNIAEGKTPRAVPPRRSRRHFSHFRQNSNNKFRFGRKQIIFVGFGDTRNVVVCSTSIWRRRISAGAKLERAGAEIGRDRSHRRRWRKVGNCERIWRRRTVTIVFLREGLRIRERAKKTLIVVKVKYLYNRKQSQWNTDINYLLNCIVHLILLIFIIFNKEYK